MRDCIQVYEQEQQPWTEEMADLKQMALQKDDPENIAQFLRDKRAELLGI